MERENGMTEAGLKGRKYRTSPETTLSRMPTRNFCFLEGNVIREEERRKEERARK